MVWNKGLKGAQTAWNKGLTKETNPIIAEYSKKIAITLKGRMPKATPEGNRKISESKKGDKNPAKRSEVRDKISRSLIKMYEEHPEILCNRKRSGYSQFTGAYSSLEKIIANKLDELHIPFVHNYRIGKYFADFVIDEVIVIECDGEYWHRAKDKELRRDNYLYDKGYFVLHLNGKRILKDLAGAMAGIRSVRRIVMTKRKADIWWTPWSCGLPM